MYHPLLRNLSLEVTDAPDTVTEAVSMEGFNAAQIEVTVTRMTATDLNVTIQLSNDLENWRDLSGSTETISGEGFDLGTKRTGIAAAYVRLKLEVAGSAGDLALLAAGIHLSKQG